MFGLEMLEVLLGLIVVYLVLSVVCSAFREAVAGLLNERGKLLEKGVEQLVGLDVSGRIYEHALVRGLYRDERKPSYIPSAHFAVALMEVVSRGSAPGEAGVRTDTPTLRAAAIQSPAGSNVREALLAAIDHAGEDLDQTRRNLEAWFNGAMDRVSGWYKRQTQWIILASATAVTLGLNVNTITLVQHLAADEALRARLVASADAMDALPDTTDLDAAVARVEALSLPIGWAAGWPGPQRALWSRGADGNFWSCNRGIYACAVQPLAGLLLTILAISLGAPFWFDILNKVMVIRSTVKPEEKSPPEASEDRQGKNPGSATPTWGSGSAATAEGGSGSTTAVPFHPHRWEGSEDPDGGVL